MLRTAVGDNSLASYTFSSPCCDQVNHLIASTRQRSWVQKMMMGSSVSTTKELTVV